MTLQELLDWLEDHGIDLTSQATVDSVRIYHQLDAYTQRPLEADDLFIDNDGDVVVMG